MDKRTHITLTALELFYDKGIHTVGINEIISAANVAKKTMYHHFAGKDELILACLNERHTTFITWLENATNQQTTLHDFQERLFTSFEDWFHSKVAELGNFNGCMFINAAAEYSAPQSPVNLACKAHKAAVSSLIKQRLSECKDVKAEKIDSLCHYLMTLTEGMICQAKVSGMKQFPRLLN
ncbi:TetR/AcrR family transcriptional regulator [Pseudoalteromonas lipolytica]|uniref:TetR/AcrR family transcriptional regulator n=1 Tax=Pseudoalteromonas lipolytica TaxID=570156 RepID=UPI003A9698F9